MTEYGRERAVQGAGEKNCVPVFRKGVLNIDSVSLTFFLSSSAASAALLSSAATLNLALLRVGVLAAIGVRMRLVLNVMLNGLFGGVQGLEGVDGRSSSSSASLVAALLNEIRTAGFRVG